MEYRRDDLVASRLGRRKCERFFRLWPEDGDIVSAQNVRAIELVERIDCRIISDVYNVCNTDEITNEWSRERRVIRLSDDRFDDNR